MNKIVKVTGLIIALLAMVSSAHADVLIGNLTAYTNDSGGTTNVPAYGKEIGFTTGPNACTLSDVVLRLNVGASTNLPVISLYSGGSTGSTTTPPTALVTTFANPTFTYGTTTNYTFTPATPILLTPNTAYWIVVESSGTTPQIGWVSGSPGVAFTGADEISYSLLLGSVSTAPTTWTTTSTAYNWFQVDGTQSPAIGNITGYTNDSGAATVLPAIGGKEIGFTTGPNGYTLSDVVLRLNVAGSTNLPVVSLYSGGITGSTTTPPTTLVTTFANPTFTYGTTTNYTFTPASPVLLAPNTVYWIVLQTGSGSTNISWISGSPGVAYTGSDEVSYSLLYGNVGVGPTGWTTTSSTFNWMEVEGYPTFWRIGLNNGSGSEFTGTSIPTSYTIPSTWPSQTTWPEWPSVNYWHTWQTDISYTLTSVPAGGALFTLQATNAMQLVPELAVYSNGNPCGIIQIGADGSIGFGTYSHNRLFRQPYQIYIPPQFLHIGTNDLHLSRLASPYCTSNTNVYYIDFSLDYMQLDGLAETPSDPIHSKMSYIGISEGGTYFGNGTTGNPADGIANAAQSLDEWLGIAYSGNPARVCFWSNNSWELSLSHELTYLNTLKGLNMSVVLDGLSCEASTDSMIVGGQLPASDQTYLNTFFSNFGSLAQFYELCNEPCQSFTNASYLYVKTVAGYVNTIKPSSLVIEAPGYAYGGGYGSPLNWDSATNDANRQALDALCGAYGGHSFGSPGWGMDSGDLAETIDADGTYVSGVPQFLDGFDKPFVSTECGASDGVYENITQIPTTTPYAAALDRNLRANVAFTDYMCVADAFYNGPYNLLDGNYYDPTSWTAHLCGGPGKDPISKLQVFRRLALAYGTHGSPLPYVYSGIPSGTYPLIYFRAVNTATLAPLPGSGATSNKLLLSFVNFDYFNSNTITVTVTMPRSGTYTGVCYGAGNTIATAKSTVNLTTNSSNQLTFTLTLPPGESTEYILNP